MHRDRARQFPDEFGHDLLVKLGGEIGDVAGAQAVVKQWRSAAEQSFLGFDLMVMPVFPGEAPTVEEVMQDYAAKKLTTSSPAGDHPLVNALGWPALVVPTDAGPQQVIGRPGSEAAIVAFGRVICSRVYDPVA